jgi:hypothetical protein
MRIVTDYITRRELEALAADSFGNLVKAVVDVQRELLALDAEMHSDLEAYLLQNGSRQESLWGINLYPELSGEDFIEFDSMINVRPGAGNRSRGVDDESTRKLIIEIVQRRVRA